MIAAVITFWISLAACVYIYFGYPALLWILSRVRTRPVAEADIRPSMTMIVPAHNEERTIEAKLANTLELDYPPEQLEILVVSNGSTDRTCEIVRSANDPRVRLIDLPEAGKVAALNEGAGQAAGDVLVFSDADFLLERDALLHIARKFADPTVGGVCGARSNARRDGDATGEGEGLYARWDRWQKVLESRIGSVFAADGLLYAIRRKLFVPVADPAQADDIAISVQIPLQGHRLLFEPRAAAWENATVNAEEEFHRKIRVTGHSVAALLKLRSRLFTSGFYSLELLSHKLVRHFIPFFLISLFASNAALLRRAPFYLLTMLGQLFIYALAAAGALLRNKPAGKAKPLYVPYYFAFVNAAALLGIVSMLRGKRTAVWSTRSASKESAPQPLDGAAKSFPKGHRLG
jgi:poly-beta-1,6-N-acetyl-D-glucosamine synthase